MPFLSWAQRRTGRALGSDAVVAESSQTLLCTYLSAVLLVGLAQRHARLVVGRPCRRARHRGRRGQEGLQAWCGESCGCGPVVPGAVTGAADDACGCAGGCGDR
ncbi:hypothetical protein GCM10023339_07370 [Alloalcanivorax gelatiniphagus]